VLLAVESVLSMERKLSMVESTCQVTFTVNLSPSAEAGCFAGFYMLGLLDMT